MCCLTRLGEDRLVTIWSWPRPKSSDYVLKMTTEATLFEADTIVFYSWVEYSWSIVEIKDHVSDDGIVVPKWRLTPVIS